MSGEAEESGETQSPTSAPETVPTPAGAAVPHSPQSAHGFRHHSIEFRFLAELKHRNVGRIAILYLVVCWLILEPVHVIFHMLEVPVWANRLVIILMALGFPAVAIFAWVYEITPEGVKPTADVHHEQSIRRQTGRRIDRAIIVVLGLALTYFVMDKFWLSKQSAEERPVAAVPGTVPASPIIPGTPVIPGKSVAVLPFVDMSEKKNQQYFADGMAEEVLDLIAKVPGVRVIGRTSSFQFKSSSDDPRAVGHTLGAAYIIEGSVRQSGDRLRVTAELISASDGSHLWSQTYDEKAGDVLAIQDRIASGIVRALQVAVGADGLQEQPPLKSAAAYDLYLRGRHEMDRFDKTGFENAAGYFNQALAIDPSLVRAAEWLGASQEFTAEWGFVPVREGYELTRKSLQHALQLDPRSGLAHSLMCTVNAIYDWDSAAAIEECRIALTLEPRNPQVLGYAGQIQAVVGHWDEAARLTAESIALDPLFAGWHDLLAIIRDRTGHLKEAEIERRRTLDISPTYERAHFDLGLTLVAEGNLDQALSEMQKETSDGGRDAGLAIVYNAMARKSASDAALGRYTKQREGDRAYRIAQIHAYRGEADAAFAWLDRAYKQKDVDLLWFKGNLAFKDLESDQRYKAFLRRLKLPE
jgi:adenylate cyclase